MALDAKQNQYKHYKTMKIPKEAKVELCVSDDSTRGAITEPYLDVTDGKGTMIATDGRKMAIVPVELEEHDVAGYVSGKALVAARKLAKRDVNAVLTVNGVCKLLDGSQFPRPFAAPEGWQGEWIGKRFPNWRQVIPDKDRKVGFRVALDAELLLTLAKSIGVESGQGVTLEFGEDDRDSILVKGGRVGGCGVLMPMRIS